MFYALPIDLMDRKVKLEAKGTFCGTRTKKPAFADGQNRSNKVSQKPKMGQILLGIFRMIKNKKQPTGMFELISSCC